MKRILIAIVAVAGVAGLIALLNYHPKSGSQASSGKSKSSSSAPGNYKDGTYTGTSVDVGYGMVQVSAVVSGGKLAAVDFLQMPSGEQRTNMVTNLAKTQLLQEAISAQSANVDLVTGATSDWQGFRQSLQSALDQAKA